MKEFFYQINKSCVILFDRYDGEKDDVDNSTEEWKNLEQNLETGLDQDTRNALTLF
jgi:hypothetical protein